MYVCIYIYIYVLYIYIDYTRRCILRHIIIILYHIISYSICLHPVHVAFQIETGEPYLD